MSLIIRTILSCMAIALAAAPAPAQTPEERTRLEWVVERGRLLFEVDRAAWVTTDDLRERVGDHERAGIRGWTVEREGDGYAVVYYAGEGESRAAVYRARVQDNRVVSSEVIPEGSRPPLTPFQRRLADARDAVTGVEIRACERSGLNLAVIPPAGPDEPLDLYVLTPQTQVGVYPFGGHTRATLSPAGEILSQRYFANTCISMDNRPQGERGRAESLLITHLLDPIPTEIHVFLSIWMGLPIYVGAGDRLWEVAGDRIRFVSNIEDAPKP